MAFSYMAVLLMLLGQGRGDLLDYVPTDAYWQSKHVTVTAEGLTAELAPAKSGVDISQALKDLESDQFAVRKAARATIEAAGPAAAEQLKTALDSKDPEVAGVAKELLAKYASKGKDKEVRELMAIRTLGERKEASALPALQALTTSKDRFVADYANRAIAQIGGKPADVTVDAAKADADVWLLPKDTGILVQSNSGMGKELTIAKMMENLPDAELAQQNMTKEKLTGIAVQQIIDIAERIGDVRLDGVTLGIAEQIGPNAGWVMGVGRGKFDPNTLGTVFNGAAGGMHEETFKETQDGDLKIFENSNLSLILVGDERVVMVAGPDGPALTAIREQAVAAIKAGKGTLADSPEMVKAIGAVDRKSAAVWAVAGKIPDEIKRELPFNGFDTATATATNTNGVLHYVVEAVGSDKEQVKMSVDKLNDGIKSTLEMFKQIPAQMAATIKPVQEMLESMQCAAVDNKATLSGDVKVESLGMGLGMMFLQMHQMDATINPGGAEGAAEAAATQGGVIAPAGQ